MPLSRFQPDHYEKLLKEKVSGVCQLLAPFSVPSPHVVPSVPAGFRQRAEFRVWHDGDALDYVMFRPEDPRTPIAIETFPIAAESIQSLMPVLLDSVKSNETLRRKLFQVEFLSALSGDMVVTLIYHRALDDKWEQTAEALQQSLRDICPELSLIGRSRRQKLVLDRDYVREVLEVNGRHYHFRQYEQAFTQPNGRVNIGMLEWACHQAEGLGGDLLELYCGNGNFTLPLSQYFNQALATEVSKTSIRAARTNAEENGITNLQLVRMSAEEVAEAMAGSRVFRRLADLPRPLSDYQLDTLFVDPPRAGLDAHTVSMAKGFANILYISCNPITLADNLRSLIDTHSVKQFALFDQFPYTDHMECGVLLQRR